MSDLIPGGSYTQDPITGALTRNDAESTSDNETAAVAEIVPVQVPAPAEPAAPVADPIPSTTTANRRQAPTADKD